MLTDHRKANTRRLRLYPWGGVEVGKDQRGNNLDFVVDRQFYTDLREFHDDHKVRGYLTPLAFSHRPAVDGPADEALLKALTPGWITELGEDEQGIWADAYMADGVAKLWDQGLLSSLSPSHYTNFKNPHTGKVYRRGLREVSAIGVRHLKDLPIQSGYYQLAEGGAWTAITQLEEQESPMTTANNTQNTTTDPAPLTSEQVAKLITDGIATGLAPVVQTVTSLSEQVEALKAKPDTTVTNNGEQGETADQKRVRELEAQVTKLTRDAQLAQNKATVMGRLPGADVTLVTSLSETLISNPAQGEVLIKGFEPLHGVEAVKSRTQTQTTTILGEQGRTGDSAGGSKIPLSRAKAEAAAAGKAPGQPQLDWALAQYGAARLDMSA